MKICVNQIDAMQDFSRKIVASEIRKFTSIKCSFFNVFTMQSIIFEKNLLICFINQSFSYSSKK